jgi:predicted site-specific integrase-resolvase
MKFSKDFRGSHWAANYLGVTTQTLHNWRKKGDYIKCHKLGGRFYYKIDELEEFLERASQAYVPIQKDEK